MINYDIIGGVMPESLVLNSETGEISGDISYASVDEGPVWQSPVSGQIGDWEVGDTIAEIDFVAQPRTDGPALSHYSVVGTSNLLPWGLLLNSASGALTGTVAQLKAFQIKENENVNPPVWNSPSALIADLGEGETMTNYTFSATAQMSKTISNYLIRGALPWGLVLNQDTGVLSGTAAELKNAPNAIDVPKTPTPTWVTPAGQLADVREGDTVDLSIKANMVEGRTLVNYFITRGMIAPGLFLNPTTGGIAGTVAEIRLLDQPEYVDPLKDPTISTTVKVNGTDMVVPSGSSLGTFTKGSSISIVFTPVIVSERTYSSLSMTPGIMPWGLTLDQTNYTLSGTIPASTSSGEYSFTLKVVDSAQAWTSSMYTFTVQ